MNVKSSLVLIIVLWLVATVAHYAVQVPVEAAWFGPAVQAVGYVARVGILGLVLWLGWQFVKPHLKQAIQPPQEVQAASRDLDTLSMVLSKLDGVQGEQAQRHLADAKVLTQHILQAAGGVAKQAEEFSRRCQILDEALDAISRQDRLKMAALAGRATWDETISTALLSDVAWENGPYWVSVSKLLSSQLGVHSEWGRIYQDYSAALIDRVALEKSKVTALAAASDFISASRQLATIDQNLLQAQSCLRIDQPMVRHRLRAALPVGVKMLQG